MVSTRTCCMDSGGLRKDPCTAAELSVLAALKSEHAHLKHVVGTETLPRQKVIAAMARNISRGKKRTEIAV